MDLPQDQSVDDRSQLLTGQNFSSSDVEPPYDQAFMQETGLHPRTEAGGQGLGETAADVSENSRGTSLQSAREQDDEERGPQPLRLQQLQESPGHSELSRMERGSVAVQPLGPGWAASVTQAFGNPSDLRSHAFSDSAVKHMEVDEQELIPDYQSLPRLEPAVKPEPAEPVGQAGSSGPVSAAVGAMPSSGAAAMVPSEALGSMVAQLMQPWMEQLMNNQVLLMARMEKMEFARAQSERLSAERAASRSHQGEEGLSRQAVQEPVQSEQAQRQVFVML